MGFWSWLTSPHGGEKHLKPSWKKSQDEQVEKDSSKQLIETSSLEDCIQAYKNALSGSPTERLAEDKAKKLARTFGDWVLIFQSVSPISSLGNFALTQLPISARTFDDWRQIYLICLEDEIRSTALNKMAALAHSREEQIEVYKLAPDGSAMEVIILSALKSQAKTLEEWSAIFNSSDGELQKFAAGMVVDLTPDDLGELSYLLACDAIISNSVLEEKVLTRIKTLKLPPEKWIAAIDNGDLEAEVRAIAFGKVADDPEMAGKSFEDWKEIFETAEEGSDFEKHAAIMAVEKAPSDNPVALAELLGYSAIFDNSDLQEKVMEKLKSVTPAAFDKWKDIYERTEDDDVKEIARDKMIEGIDSLDRLIEVDEAVDSDDQDDDFDDKICTKAKAILLTEEACRRITEGFYANTVLFEVALRQMLKLATTTKECFDLFISLIDEWHDEDGDTNNDLLDEAADKLMSVSTPTEIYIMSKLGDDDFETLAQKAENKLLPHS